MTSVVVVGDDARLGGRVAQGLSNRGLLVHLVGESASHGAVEAAFAAASAAGEPVTAVVHARVEPGANQPRPLAEIGDEEWDRLADAPVRAALATLQAAHRHLTAGGRIVVVVPAVSLTGQDGLVPLCTAGEAQRVLAKSAARRWGSDGITVNVVAASLTDLGGPTAVTTARGPALPAAAGGDQGADDDLVATVALLLSPLAARLTGATLCADGGDLMAP